MQFLHAGLGLKYDVIGHSTSSEQWRCQTKFCKEQILNEFLLVEECTDPGVDWTDSLC